MQMRDFQAALLAEFHHGYTKRVLFYNGGKLAENWFADQALSDCMPL